MLKILIKSVFHRLDTPAISSIAPVTNTSAMHFLDN